VCSSDLQEHHESEDYAGFGFHRVNLFQGFE